MIRRLQPYMVRIGPIPLLPALVICVLLFSGFTCHSTDPFDDDTGEAEASYLVLNADDGLADSFVTDVLYDPGRNGVWIATMNGITFFDNADSSLTTFGAEADVPSLEYTSLAYDPGTGDVWAGTDTGAAVYSENFGWSMFTDLLGRNIADIHVHSDGSLWFATRTGIEVFTATEWISYTVTDGLVHNAVNAFAEQSDGVLWIGTQFGLNSFENGIMMLYSGTLLPSQVVYALAVLPDDSVWAGTANGVAVNHDGAWTVTGTADGLPHSVVNALAYTGNKGLFAATMGGAARYSDGRWYSFGLPERVSAYAVTCVAGDPDTGAVWFGTRGGVVRYDPGNSQL